MTISKEAVEAAAQFLWSKEMNAQWSSVSDGFKSPFRRDARAALEAAAPFIAAKALEDAADAYQPKLLHVGTVHDQFRAWLRARAAAVRGDG